MRNGQREEEERRTRLTSRLSLMSARYVTYSYLHFTTVPVPVPLAVFKMLFNHVFGPN